jgi:arginyl-tRNA synthetase
MVVTEFSFTAKNRILLDMMIRSLLEECVKRVLEKLDLRSCEIVVEYCADSAHGDFATNAAMVAAKVAGMPSRELAEKIVKNMQTPESVAKVEVAGPGFINFHLAEKFFTAQTEYVLEAAEAWGTNTKREGQTILLEHSSPNLFKPFHIGHLVNNTLGEALVRIVRATGAKVTALSFPSDVSPGIAKAVWGVLDRGWQEDITLARIGEAYVHGVKSYEENKEVRARIDEINASLYSQKKDTKEWEVYEKGKVSSTSYFEHITEKLGSKFDALIFESEAEAEGKEIVIENTPTVFEKSDGATIFRGSRYGLFDNVFINSAGFGTYLAKDIGLLSIKFGKYKFNLSITVTDIEQKQHFQLVQKAAECVNPEWASKSLFLQHGRLRLTSGKVSSRSGNVPLAEDILSSVEARATERMKSNEKEADAETASNIAIAAIKYAIARVGMGKNITFDMEHSLSLEGDSGPYLQYTYARARSVLQKAGAKAARAPLLRGGLAVTDVERLLHRFPEVVERAANEYEPHYIANYLTELASTFNTWYAKEQILDGGEAEGYKLALTEAVSVTIKNGLWLLGIPAPERM